MSERWWDLLEDSSTRPDYPGPLAAPTVPGHELVGYEYWGSESTYTGAPDECNIHWPTKLDGKGECLTCKTEPEYRSYT